METLKKNCSFDEETKKNTLIEIEKIYSLKRKIINPFSPSPNIFIHKLKIRMLKYYNDLYNSKNLEIK
jgi:hypothetical protein